MSDDAKEQIAKIIQADVFLGGSYSALYSAQHIMAAITSGEIVVPVGDAVRDVLAERRRQIEVEGWTIEHDDAHANGEMARAAAVYAMPSYKDLKHGERRPRAPIMEFWPWDIEWFKPKDRRRDLVRAGALIVAEIERLDRQAAASDAPTPGVQP